MDWRWSIDGSDVSSLSGLTFATSASSSCTDPWSSPGFVEEEDEDVNDYKWDEEDDFLSVPKLEPMDEVDLTKFSLVSGLKEDIIPELPSALKPAEARRPRGRPRKHPQGYPSTTKWQGGKEIGRSKVGCITCRRRKKKCDETKPSCMNCEKNSVPCEGYPNRTIWRSGKEKAEEARSFQIQSIQLPYLIHGIETASDRIFLHHYISRLSLIFTLEGERESPLTHIFLPMAQMHAGLMHSILALSSKHIDYTSPYGVQLLRENPSVNIELLQERSEFHQDQAISEMVNQSKLKVQPATFAQMICLILQTLVGPSRSKEYRLHLRYYQQLIHENQQEDGESMKFIHEFFQYHIHADQLIQFRPFRPGEMNASDDWNRPTTALQGSGAPVLGAFDGIFFYMSKVANIRSKIRHKMEQGIEPIVDYSTYYAAAEIDAGIREWTPTWPVGDPRDTIGLLFRQMMWVYLYRTVYLPQTTNWKVNPRITAAVNNSVSLLGLFTPRDPSQTLLLAPLFVIGCAAFEIEQRDVVRNAIGGVKLYMKYKNTDAILGVLEEVWRLMDAKDERSWDWESIAHRTGMDFLSICDEAKPGCKNCNKKSVECECRPQQPVSDNLSFKCLVRSCPQPNLVFFTLEARISHYEAFHPNLLVRCTVAECHQSPSVFLEENDRIKHHEQKHADIPYNKLQLIEAAKGVFRGSNSTIPQINEDSEIHPVPPLTDDQCPENDHNELKGDPSVQKLNLISDTDDHAQSPGINADDTNVEEPSPGCMPAPPSLKHECESVDSFCGPSIESLASSALSAGFETDSTFSGDETDWEEDRIFMTPTDHNILDLIREGIHVETSIEGESLIGPVLTPMKRALVEGIMKDFWVIFNQEWLANIRKCTNSPSAPSYASNPPGSSPSSDKSSRKPNGSQRKRGYNDDDDGSPEDDSNEDPKRPRTTPFPPEAQKENVKFACPYRKHNPRKYNHCIRTWRSCALTSFESVARVKGHLYRHHRIFQCERCSELFKNEDERKSHFMAVKPCELKPPVAAEGITCELEKQLRNRKRTLGDQSHEEKWKGIYRILFPLEVVPSPYFEISQDDITQSPSSMELSNYEEYSRQELPRVFRSALEAAVDDEAQPIEERLRSQLVNMIQECQGRVFSTYRTRHTSNTSTDPPHGRGRNTDIAINSFSPAPPESVNSNVGGRHISENMLETFYQPPPFQHHSQSTSDFMLLNSDQTSRAETQNNISDSGYVSDLSAFHNSGSRSELSTERFAVDTIPDTGSQIHELSQIIRSDIGMSQHFESFLDNDLSIAIPTTTSGLNNNALPGLDNTSALNMYGNYEDFDWNEHFLSN